MLKVHTLFAIDSQKELNAQAPNQTQPPAQESTKSTSKSGALPMEGALRNRAGQKFDDSDLLQQKHPEQDDGKISKTIKRLLFFLIFFRFAFF